MTTTGNCAISGTVTGPDGLTPLRGISISVFKQGIPGLWNWWSETYTDFDGKYKVEGLTPGSYSLKYDESSDGIYGAQFYSTTAQPETATQIVLTDGVTVPEINGSLKKLGQITGKITGPNGTTPLRSTRITTYRSDTLGGWDVIKVDYTQTDGTYKIESLYPTAYRLEFSGPHGYGAEFYNNVSELQSAVSIPIEYGGVVSGINASLNELGKITGIVTGPNGSSPLSEVVVTAFRSDSGQGWIQERYAYTGSNGEYTLANLKAGNYRILFSQSYNITHKEEFYNNVVNIEAAMDVAVSDNVTTSGISGSLTELGRITGKITASDGITPLREIAVTAYRQTEGADWIYAGVTSTEFDGSYSLKGLKTGSYRIKFYDDYNLDYNIEFYNNSAEIDFATDIVVTESTTTSGIDASLTEKAKINGTVTGPDQITPLRDIEVMVYRLDRNIGWTSIRRVSTQADGSYRIRGLDAGRYRLRFYDSAYSIFANKYYPGVASLAAATDIIVAESSVVSGINISMGDIPIVPDVPQIPVIPPIPPIPPTPIVAKIEVSENGVILGQASTLRFKIPSGKVTTSTKTLTIKNVGGAVLSGLKVGKKGPHSANFTFSKLTVSSLAPGASATIKIVFKPSAAGNRNASVIITSSDPTKNPYMISLVGNGKKGVAKHVLLASSRRSPSSQSALNLNSATSKVGADITNGLNYRTLTVFRSSLNHASQATVEVSSNLVDWFSGDTYTTVITDDGIQLKVRDNTAVTDGSKRFIRLKAGAK